MRTFQDLWPLTNSIYGSFTELEAERMYTIVATLLFGSTLVEVGSYCGRSSSLLGQMAIEHGHELSCVDNFVSGAPGIIDVEKEFKKNMDRSRVKYQLLCMESKRAAHLFDDEEVDFVFIDGDHRYEGTRDDIKFWFPKLRKGGFMLFHDYNSSWDGVRKAVDEVKGLEDLGVTGSLMVKQKI